MSPGPRVYVPVSIRSRSRLVTWLWLRSKRGGWLDYDRAQWLARWLP